MTSNPTAFMLISPLSKLFHLYQIAVQPLENRCHSLPDVLRGVGIAS